MVKQRLASRRKFSWRLLMSGLIGTTINVIFITQPIFATALDLGYETSTIHQVVSFCSGGPGDGYGYCRRNCTSYTAYRLKADGVPVEQFSFLGNGGSWYANAQKRGLSVGSQPRVGAAAVIPANPGHVAYVEAINPDGTLRVASYDGNTESYYPEAHARQYHYFVYFSPPPKADVAVAPPPAALPIQQLIHDPVAPAVSAVTATANTASLKILKGRAATDIVKPATTHPENWQFLLADYDADNIPDIYAINRGDADHTSLTIFDGSKVDSVLASGVTALPATTDGWQFALADYNDDQIPDVYAIDFKAPGGKLQLTIVDGSELSKTLLKSPTSVVGSANQSVVVTDYSDDKIPDVYIIDRAALATGKPAIQVIDGAQPANLLRLAP